MQLDLSVAFDTVDLSVLIERLRQWVGFSGGGLDWFTFYFSWIGGFFVTLCSNMSETALSCGVPHGSVLGPILLCVLLPLSHVISK